jgi:transcriptional regulator GlxA family with amidase domain
MHRVSVLVIPPVPLFDISVPGLILGNVRVNDRPGYEVQLCTTEPGWLTTFDGVRLEIGRGLRALRHADTLIVVGAGARDGALPAPVRKALERADEKYARVASICTGAFALAEAGVLDGRRATTYWVYSEQFRRRFPNVKLSPDVLFAEDGNVVTSAGVAAGIDMCLHLVAQDYGAAVANETARQAVVPPTRSGGQAQFIQRPVVMEPRSQLRRLREWTLANLQRTLSLADLATRAHLSERTLTRRFRQETGTSPLQWLLQQRIDRARQLLETTSMPMDRIASHSGLGDADSLREHFRRRLGISPSAYRASFREDRVTSRRSPRREVS